MKKETLERSLKASLHNSIDSNDFFKTLHTAKALRDLELGNFDDSEYDELKDGDGRW